MIQNLLFDLGGVIIDLDRNRCVEAFTRLGLKDANSFFGEYSQQGAFAKLEAGQITVDQFHNELRKLLPEGATDAEIDHAFEQFLLDIPEHRLIALQELRQKYGVYLLSNTNPIHWNSIISRQFTKMGLQLDGYFDGVVTSFEAKCCKPSAEIFKYTIDHLKIKPEETLFLDDSLKNLHASEPFGFHTLHVTEDFTKLLPKQFIG
ncbi:MAG: HAD family phosphatase [Bacteroidales bacterium]|nr:HAD family phosphatase [Bacteroidales bacterium]